MEDKFKNLETERLILRKIESRDASDLYEGIYHDFDYYKYYYPLPFESYEEYQRLVDKYEEWYHNGNHFRWGMERKEDHKMIGIVQLHTKDNINNNCKLGYIISSKEKKKGYMKEALQKVIHFAFEELNYHRLEAEIVTLNIDSISLAKALHMKEERIKEESYLLKGKYYDQVVYTLINRKKDK